MSKERKVTSDDLSKVKGLGAKKAEAIEKALEGGAKTVEELAAIQGVSARIAGEVLKLAKDPDKYEPEAPTPRKVAAKKATAKAAPTPAPASNGSAKKVSADDVRKFARQAEDIGFTTFAATLRSQVAPLLGDELVEPELLGI